MWIVQVTIWNLDDGCVNHQYFHDDEIEAQEDYELCNWPFAHWNGIPIEYVTMWHEDY